ncbi:Chloramphenicol acetyltransferase [hydrothermal vent metagenome]|uniref:Chloramphenicol acetyltransferase n=1 Tax=hydrothermal vent metagenome TaxID=652676 RepID=A0A3B0SZN8_9ZZZZ
MKENIKRVILSSGFLTTIAVFFNKRYLKRKFAIKYGKNVFIGFSVICEGKNNFAYNSSISSSRIGYGSYLAEGATIRKAKIGKYCSIGPNVNCIFGKHPSSTFVSTHPAFFTSRKNIGVSYAKTQLFDEFAKPGDNQGKYSIIIGNDVWIGANVAIMDGVKIGDGAIVAANALVNKDIEPYTIVGGVPAKPIKKRFSDSHIEFLLELRWWNKPEKWIVEHAGLFVDIETFYKKIMNAQD